MLIGLLEDDLAIQQMLQIVLEGVGHEVAIYPTAETCLAALHITEQASGLPIPDLLIADQRLPKSAFGTDVIELMRANPRLNALPIILMTASAFPNKSDLARLRVTLLAKPFDIDEIVRLVDELTSSRS
ncbi:MAG: response regulator [Ktedonobacteraceae bacterium]